MLHKPLLLDVLFDRTISSDPLDMFIDREKYYEKMEYCKQVLTDLEKQKRLHFVEGLGYVYKNPDGSIAAFDNEEEAKRILALTEEPKDSSNPQQETPVENSVKVKGEDDSIKVKSELNKENLPEKEEQIDIPGTPSKLAVNTPFIGAGLLDAYLTNKHIYDLS